MVIASFNSIVITRGKVSGASKCSSRSFQFYCYYSIVILVVYIGKDVALSILLLLLRLWVKSLIAFDEIAFNSIVITHSYYQRQGILKLLGFQFYCYYSDFARTFILPKYIKTFNSIVITPQ